MNEIINLDKKIFLWLNQFHTEILDFVMYWASHKFVWIPFYAFLVYLIFKSKGVKKMFHSIGIIGFTIISGESTAQGFKNYFQRLRPCNDTEIQEYVHTVMNSCKGSFSFVSAFLQK